MNEQVSDRVAAELFGYSHHVSSTSDVYTVAEFRSACSIGSFIDYDGFGYPMLGGRSNPRVLIWPSCVQDIPSEATHIEWFNR